MNPTKVPDDEQIRPASAVSTEDGWSCKINLDASKDWSASTFTVESSAPDTYPMTVDQSHKASSPPYIVLALSPAALFNIPDQVVRWNLAEDRVLDRTFLTGLVRLLPR